MLIVVTSESKEHQGRCPRSQFLRSHRSIPLWKFEVSKDHVLARLELPDCHVGAENSGRPRPGARRLLARPSATYPAASP